MKARCEIRQQVMATFFLGLIYYGALRASDKAEIILDIVFAIADVVTASHSVQTAWFPICSGL